MLNLILLVKLKILFKKIYNFVVCNREVWWSDLEFGICKGIVKVFYSFCLGGEEMSINVVIVSCIYVILFF